MKIDLNNLQQSRAQRLKKISEQTDWDIIVVGGGVTGAGILKLASQIGLNALLLEQKDFAWGSSSRSSKMVHGGLRYIIEGQIKLTRESVHERQRLLNDADELVTQQSFSFSHYAKEFPWPWLFNCVLWVYDRFSGKKQHQYWLKKDYQYLVPGIPLHHLIGGTQFTDAMTDDARLVLRLIQEAQQKSAEAINYVKVTELKKENGKVVGVTACTENGQTLNINARVVINATGAWAKDLHVQSGQSIELRPLRGSHLIVPSWRLPVATAISIVHPEDKRPVQIYPWNNVTVIGTTDVEHSLPLSSEPAISQQEFDYLMVCAEQLFPSAKLSKQDIISTYAGVRPIIDSGTSLEPSQEKREHSISHTPGFISVAGGKLTTFHVIAKQVLGFVLDELKPNRDKDLFELEFPVFEQAEFDFRSSELSVSELPETIKKHVLAYYGSLSEAFILQSDFENLSPIGYSKNLWAELVWAVKYEQVIHLDDLLLRRTRIGNVLPVGGILEIDKIKNLCFKDLGWSNEKWSQEIERYKTIWKRCYSLPEQQ